MIHHDAPGAILARYEVFQEGKSALKPPQGARGPLFHAYIQKPKTNAEKKVDTSHTIKRVAHSKNQIQLNKFVKSYVYEYGAF